MKLFNNFNGLFLSMSVLIASPVLSQPCFDFIKGSHSERSMEVMQDNEYVVRSKATGNFYCNPLVLNGQPLDYTQFSPQLKGELTLTKGALSLGKRVQIPFYIHLRRNGALVKLPDEALSGEHLKIEVSRILKFAQKGDQLIIEPANSDDWPAKRILKLVEADDC